jgi:hypothetical protein
MAIRCNALENMFKLSYLLLPNNFPVGSLEARAPMSHSWRRPSMTMCYGEMNTRAAGICKAGLTMWYMPLCLSSLSELELDKDVTALREL